MGHKCGSGCKRKTGVACATCRHSGTLSPTRHAAPNEVAAAVDMYFDGLSYRAVARNMGDHFNLETGPTTVHRWVQDYSQQATEIAKDYPLPTGSEWVADEVEVKVGGQRYWLFNVMDAASRFVLAAHLSPERTTRAAATAMAMARERAANPPETIKTDGLRSYREGVARAFPTHPVKHVVSEGIRAKINNNLSERLQGTFRDRDKTLRSMKKQDTGQAYIDGLVLDYNYFRPHIGIDGKTPADAAGADTPFKSWAEVATLGQDDTSTGPSKEKQTVIEAMQSASGVKSAVKKDVVEWLGTLPDDDPRWEDWAQKVPGDPFGYMTLTSAYQSRGAKPKAKNRDAKPKAKPAETITVYHGTSKDWDPTRPGQGQQFHYANGPAFQGFWVTTDRAEAEHYLTGTDADVVHVYEMDLSRGLRFSEEMDSWEEVPADVAAILGAEGEDNHVVHDTSILRHVETIDLGQGA